MLGFYASAVGGVIRPVSAYSSSVLTASVAKTLTSDQQSGASASLIGGVIRPLSASQYTALTASLVQDQGGAASNQYSDVSAALVGGVIRPGASDQASTVGAPCLAALSGRFRPANTQRRRRSCHLRRSNPYPRSNTASSARRRCITTRSRRSLMG